MEESLKQIVKETAKVLKYAKVHRQAQDTLDFLEQKNNFLSYKPYQIRARCLEAFQTAIESKNQRLASFAVSGIQHMLKDAQMHSSESGMKEEELEQWFPLQILTILHSTSSLSEDVQVEVMRLLLNMSLSLPQSMCAAVVINIIKLCLESLTIANRQTVKNFVFNTFLRMIHLFSVKASDPDSCEEMLELYYSNSNVMVNTAVRGTFNQLLSSLNDRLLENESIVVRGADDKTYIFPENTNENGSGMSAIAPKEDDFIAVFQYICDNLSHSHSSSSEPLLLEGVLVLLAKLPPSINGLPMFHDLIWQKLCPTLISILANPMNDKTLVVSKLTSAPNDEVGRGSACSSNVPAVSSTSAKIIYSIAMSLIKTLGRYSSLRPVFESLFHRMLLYPYPAYRLDVIKSLKPLLSSPVGLITLCGPMIKDDKEKPGSSKNRSLTDMRLIKIIMDSLQECSHSNDTAVVVASVDLINEFLTAIEVMVQSSMTLHEDYDDTKSLNENNPHLEDDGETKMESQNCANSEAECRKNLVNKFMSGLTQILSDLCKCSDILFADDIILNFSSKFCAEMNFEGSETILNADAVYVTSYSALHLGVNLYCSGYYTSHEKSLPMSQDQFINNILGAGLLLYVSRSWLKEIFKQIISSDVLNLNKFSDELKDFKRSSFLMLLNDLNGFNSYRVGGQMLSVYQDDLEKLNAKNYFLFHQKGQQLAHNILMQCWDAILEVLSVLASGKGSCSNSSLMLLFNGKEETKRMRLAICASLEGLQKAARLSSVLGLQSRSGSVFALLATASCVVELEDIKKEKQQSHQADKLNNSNKSAIVPFATSIPPSFTHLTSTISSSFRPKLARLHAAHALSMDVLLSIGLEMGSQSYDCWKNVFKCCAHISELEHTYFTSDSRSLYSSMTKLQKLDNNCIEFVSEEDGIENVEVYLNCASSSSEPVAQQINVKEVIEQSRLESGWDVAGGGVLSSKQASKVLCGLSQEVDKLFEDAAIKLNMKSLLEFLTELCKSSELQLLEIEEDDESSCFLPTNALHLFRLGDIMNRCINNSKRPLLHIMKAWSVVSQHLTKAACHTDQRISKKAVSCIHEIVTSLLSSRQELPLFHFNEFLCKPFENLLCLELCDGDIQDQIVCSICELVEACPCNMKSGWKPLFSALRSVKIENTLMEEVNVARQRHVAAVLDVFDVFLATDNILVFANAAVDCILCLLRYVRGPGEFRGEDSDSDFDEDPPLDGIAYNNLCLPALKYLGQCADYLASMWVLPNTPAFSGAQRIHSTEFQKLPLLPSNMDINSFLKTFHDLEGTAEKEERSRNVLNHVSKQEPTSGGNKELHVEDVNGDDLPNDKLCSEDEKSDSVDSDSSDAVDPKYADATTSGSHDEVNIKTCTERDHEEVMFVESSDSDVTKQVCQSVDDGKILRNGIVKSTLVDGCATSSDPILDIDDASGVLRVYHLLVEGLTSAVFECSKNYQPQTLEALFELIRSSAKCPGPKFAFHCFNNILMPTLQSWTRRGQTTSYWNSQTTSNCKHFMGLSVDLLVEFVVQFVDDVNLNECLEFMLHQQLAILIEFIAQPIEFLSRLGCSCIRHCLMNCGFVLTQKMWDIALDAMKNCFDVTLFNLRCLVVPFHDNSDSFYGDDGQVKVATRQDSTPADSEKLQRLSHQVFLLDCQQDQNFSEHLIDVGDDKSFVFLIYSPTTLKKDTPLIRIPFRSLVISLVSHQLLLQTLGTLLLNGTLNVVNSEKVILHEVPANQFSRKSTSLQNLALPGMLEIMTCRHSISLLDCLKLSFMAAEEFDQKPGLKFLIQKILGSDVSANLYRHAGLAMTLYVHALLEIVSNNSSTLKIDSQNTEADSIRPDKNAQWNGSQCSNGKSLHTSLEAARHSDLNVLHFVGLFAGLLRESLDYICSKYINLFLEKEGPSIADRLSQSMLVFLRVEHDDLPTLKKEWSLKEVVTEKLRRSSSLEVNDVNHQVTPNGLKNSKAVFCDENLQEDPDNLKSMELVDMSTLDQQLKSEADDKVCKLASDNTLKALVGEYRKRKQSRSMPSSSTIRSKFKLAAAKNELYPEIYKQQKTSYLKDSEAHLRSRAEVLCNILQLLDQLSDQQYCALLPIFHQFVVNLTRHSTDAQLRQAISHWISRIGRIYNFCELSA